jgi:histidine triad (HIT) family protein
VQDPNCVFCRIASGEIPAARIYEDELCIAFRDLTPQAPTHVLVIPREHVESLADTTAWPLGGALLAACASVARAEGLVEHGYRVVTNVGRDGGQSVFHLHFHVLGGRAMGWPPG